MKPTLFIALIMIAAMILLPVAPAAAVTGTRCYVDITATSGADTGADWANAFLNLQEALVPESACTEI